MLSLLNPFWKYICAVFSASTLVLALVVKIQAGQIHKWHTHSNEVVAARAADQAAYRAAQAQAAALNDQQVTKAKQQQKDISDAQVGTLNDRLELISRELRNQQSNPAGRPPVSAKAGDASPSPCTVTDPAWMCLSPEARLSAADNEERHDELIDWVLAQETLDPNK